MLEQVLTQVMTLVMTHIQLITAALIFIVAALELIHIGQTSRINKKLSRAGRWLQRYLNTVFSENTQEYLEEETEQKVPGSMRTSTQGRFVQLDVESPRSIQEEKMRATLEQKKLKKDEELLDSVLQEIFD